MGYVDCKLTIKDREKIEYEDDYGRKVEGTVLQDELPRMTVERFNHWVANYEDKCKREDLQILGMHLYALLFNEDLKTQFERTYDVFEKQKQNNADLRLRLILIFHETARELAAYPWEFIFMQRKPKGFFLAGENAELILTRFVPPSPLVKQLGPEERPLRILIASCQPKESGEITANDVIEHINSLKSDRIQVKCITNPDFDELYNAINDKEFKPHILHFIGHGEAGAIALFRDKKELQREEIVARTTGGRVREAQWIDSKQVSKLFDKYPPPRLIFLHACKGAAADSLNSFKSTALELIYSNIPAVVAMQYKITNEDAGRFAETFYQEIGQGKRIDEAVNAGRRQLGMYPVTRGAFNDRGFGTPVVYLQSENAIIFSRESLAQREPEIEPPAPSKAKVPCPYPDCTGYVVVTNKVCVTCRRPLMLCPNGHVMAKNLGICGECEYEIESSMARTPPETAQQEAKPSMKPELQPRADKKAVPLEPQPAGTFAAPVQSPSQQGQLVADDKAQKRQG